MTGHIGEDMIGTDTMSCSRCGGLMITELNPEILDELFLPESYTVRCLNCGNIEDAIIRLNRARRHSSLSLARTASWIPVEERMS